MIRIGKAFRLSNSLTQKKSFQFFHESRMLGSDVVRLRVIGIEIVELQGRRLGPDQFVFPADDGLTVTCFVNNKVPVTLVAAPQKGRSDGNAVDTHGSRDAGKFAKGGKQVGHINDLLTISARSKF